MSEYTFEELMHCVNTLQNESTPRSNQNIHLHEIRGKIENISDFGDFFLNQTEYIEYPEHHIEISRIDPNIVVFIRNKSGIALHSLNIIFKRIEAKLLQSGVKLEQ